MIIYWDPKVSVSWHIDQDPERTSSGWSSVKQNALWINGCSEHGSDLGHGSGLSQRLTAARVHGV